MKRKPTGKTYIFTTVKEIVDQLSADQIDDFLRDFGTFLRLAKTGKSGDRKFDEFMSELSGFVNIFAELAGQKGADALKMATDRFSWCDDGKGAVSSTSLGTMNKNGKFEPSVTFKMPTK